MIATSLDASSLLSSYRHVALECDAERSAVADVDHPAHRTLEPRGHHHPCTAQAATVSLHTVDVGYRGNFVKRSRILSIVEFKLGDKRCPSYPDEDCSSERQNKSSPKREARVSHRGCRRCGAPPASPRPSPAASQSCLLPTHPPCVAPQSGTIW